MLVFDIVVVEIILLVFVRLTRLPDSVLLLFRRSKWVHAICLMRHQFANDCWVCKHNLRVGGFDNFLNCDALINLGQQLIVLINVDVGSP